ncbi:SRPBCC family protein [Isoptericola sp. NPDC019693]|uniref:SRPBCC family protein n=1 Tax=Isoptericola sp. NPDC019693 TaxID=3364009 RepID=UPI0037AF7270
MGSVNELGSIERELYVEASPDVVFEVVSRPEHVRRWWPDDADFDPEPGAAGSITFGDGPDRTVESFTVVESLPPRTFSFRWTHPSGEEATAGNSLLVTFELVPSGDGTLLRMTETGFREQGWEVAVLEQHYREHVEGWAFYLPRLVTYAGSPGVRS